MSFDVRELRDSSCFAELLQRPQCNRSEELVDDVLRLIPAQPH